MKTFAMLSVRLPSETKLALVEIARRKKWSLNQAAIEAIEEYARREKHGDDSDQS
jgi:predicted transcriptional regulator